MFNGFGLVLLTATLTTSAAAEAPISLSKALLPADVLAAIERLPENERLSFCRAPSKVEGLGLIDPVVKIEGFTSRMIDVADKLPGVRSAEGFVGEFGANAVGALVARDDNAKAALLRVLAKWSSAGAFLKSESCVRKDHTLITTGKCSEWRKPDGSDLSSMKDATFSTFLAVGLIRAYYIALADSHPEMVAEHNAIRGWIDQIALRLKAPTDVYFGLNMGWYWPAITYDLAAGRTKEAKRKLEKLGAAIVRLINDDGSIKDRTTRGDRAIWYHFTSVGEIVMSMELMRAAEIPIPAKLETRLHGAVDLFLAAVKDNRALDKWAKQAHNFEFKGYQIWDTSWLRGGDFAGSWLHVYPYRYPGRDASVELRRLVGQRAQSAIRDTDFGVGVGCLYNAAAAASAN